MAYTLTQLAADIRETLKADPGVAGREKVCGYVSRSLLDKTDTRRQSQLVRLLANAFGGLNWSGAGER